MQTACADGLDLDKIADRVITGLLGETGQQAGGFADDVTLLLVRLPDAPLATAVTEFASDPASVPAGRRFVASLLHDWACAHVTDTATLLTSEILTNAVVHGLGPVRLRLLRTDTEIAVIVSDRGRYQPSLARPHRPTKPAAALACWRCSLPAGVSAPPQRARTSGSLSPCDRPKLPPPG